MKIELNTNDKIEITFGEQLMELTLMPDGNAIMVFNNVEYKLHEGSIYVEDSMYSV
jgi:hypothetical protein